jgi:phosphoglycerate kinase
LVGGRTGNLLISEGRYDQEKRVILPIDGLNQKGENVGVTKENAEEIFDIGEATINEYKHEILKARTILLAGPMGKFEDKKFSYGTKELFLAVANCGAVKYAAGGETVEMIDNLALRSKFNFISTGGGATLDFLAGKTLPVLKKLK